MLKKKRFLIGGAIIFLAIGYLGYMGFQSSATYYYTVSELMGLENQAYDENLRVMGQVVPGSIERGALGKTLKFTIVEGHFNSTGIFHANTVMAKCPSKYEPE
ncbi:MAG: cytochrome c maturation protein CcmE [Chloroflexi bacterium]|nr:cytochrome c maturation protein CcmE [Chloroflexota bacterium]